MNATRSNDDPSLMRPKELRQELESLGIETKTFLEKSEFIEALVNARKGGKAPVSSGGNAEASSDPSSMGTKELRQELESLGIETKTFHEKREFIDALAIARKEGKTPVCGGNGAVSAARATSSSHSAESNGRTSRSVPIVIDAVPGLSVLSEFFSHDVERLLYNDRYLFSDTPEEISGPIATQFKSNNKGKRFTRHGEPKHGFQRIADMPDALVKTCNGIVESGLCDEFLACDYCLPWSYPENGSFNYHYDSRKRWGETVVGITLGCAGVMSFQPDKGNASPSPPGTRRSLNSDGLAVSVRMGGVVDVFLPPRSVYVMSGPCRGHPNWKHMVMPNNAANREYLGSSPNPSFANCVVRRTITLRSTKVFSDEVLRRASLQSPNDSRLKIRIKAQNQFRPEGEYGEGRVSKDTLQQMQRRAENEVSTVHALFPKIFFADRECGYLRRNPGRCCWPLDGAGGGGNVGTNVNTHPASSAAYGGNVGATSTIPRRATAWSLPSHLPMGNSTLPSSESSPLLKEAVRKKQKQLETLESPLSREGRSDATRNVSVGTKRKEPPTESKPVFSGNNLVNLL